MSWVHPRTLTDPPEPVAVARPRSREGTISNLLRRRVGNLPIRVPAVDWSKVVTGQKTMFRAYSERGGDRQRPVVPIETPAPRPCLLYAVRHNGPGRSRRYEAVPAWLLAHRQEPLGAITSEDLAEEGFEFRPAFKWYWQDRYRKLGWRPTDMVSVLRVRVITDTDLENMGRFLFDELYAEWL